MYYSIFLLLILDFDPGEQDVDDSTSTSSLLPRSVQDILGKAPMRTLSVKVSSTTSLALGLR
jgi:hypothetical protein